VVVATTGLAGLAGMSRMGVSVTAVTDVTIWLTVPTGTVPVAYAHAACGMRHSAFGRANDFPARPFTFRRVHFGPIAHDLADAEA
jgi:hypothetical protein